LLLVLFDIAIATASIVTIIAMLLLVHLKRFQKPKVIALSQEKARLPNRLITPVAA